MFLAGHKVRNKCRDDLVEQIAAQAIAIVDQVDGFEALQLDITVNRREQMVLDRLIATDLKMLDMAHLLDGAVVLLDPPVPVVLFRGRQCQVFKFEF